MDFRARQIDPALLQQLVQARSQDRGTTNFQQGLSGLKEGINFAVQIGDIVEKRRQAKQMAEAIDTARKSPEFQEFNKQTHGLAEVSVAKDPAGTLESFVNYVKSSKTEELQNKKLQQEMDIATGEQDIKKQKMESELQEQQLRSAFNKVRAEMLTEYKTNPKAFKATYGSEGLTIIGGKMPDWFTQFTGGGNVDPNAK